MLRYIAFSLCLLLAGCRGVSQEKELNAAGEKDEQQAYRVSKTEEEWRNELSDMEFYVLRKAGTENAGSSELLHTKEKGTYVCAGCGTPLFKSEHKFDSGTGWPSFDRAIEGNVAYDTDYNIGYARTEEHCAVATTGKRHCINGAALDFVPENK